MELLFLKADTNEIIIPVSVNFIGNDINELTGYTLSDMEIRIFTPSEYKCLDQCINVSGVGKLRDGDLVKINLYDKEFYTLHFGWYVTNDGLDLYGWYLVCSQEVRPFLQRYINTVEIIQRRNCS